jgi:hypothetical protein
VKQPAQDSTAVAPPRREIVLEMFGVGFVLETELAELASALAGRLPAGARRPARACGRRYVVAAASPPHDALIVRCGARKPARVESLERALDVVVTDLQRTLAHRADGLVFVHAGVVAWRGRALVLPGRSRSGKSELVAALVRAGADYLSDEFAVFDRDGRVHPYARPIALRRPDGARRVSPETLGGRAAGRPLRPGLIAFLRYAAGSRGRTRRLSSGQTVLGLLRHSVAARRRLPLVRSVLVPIASAVSAVSGVRGEADAQAVALLRALEAAPRAPRAAPRAPGSAQRALGSAPC